LNLYRIYDYEEENCSDEIETIKSTQSKINNLLLNVSPVPADEFLDISIQDNENRKGEIQLTDVSGRLVYTKNVVSSGVQI